jgi:hypothetical protein
MGRQNPALSMRVTFDRAAPPPRAPGRRSRFALASGQGEADDAIGSGTGSRAADAEHGAGSGIGAGTPPAR